MKLTLNALSRRYVTALKKHLQQANPDSLQAACALGQQAASLKLKSLDVARIHKAALTALDASNNGHGFAWQAKRFLAEAVITLEKIRRSERKTDVRVRKLERALGRRTVDLAASHRQLRRGVVHRHAMEKAYATNGKQRDKCLKESLLLQKRLRQLTHKVLAVQENERKKISHDLQDEIAQTLLGINVRLLSLKQSRQSNTTSLKNEIASAQRLVVKSAKSVRRFARELEVHRPAQEGPSILRPRVMLT